MFDKLSQPFPPSQISWRVGSTTGDKKKGMALAYIDARDVMNRLDEVVGPENWQDEYEIHGTRTICRLTLRIGEHWITKSDGAGDSDVEAEKGSISDAFKRAAVKWGVGRYLYDLDSPWVEIEQRGRSYAIKSSEFAKLEKLLGGKFKIVDVPKSEPIHLKADDTSKRTAYLALALEGMKVAEGTESLKAWWKSEGSNRAKYGVVKDTEEYKKLFDAFCKYGQELSNQQNVESNPFDDTDAVTLRQAG